MTERRPDLRLLWLFMDSISYLGVRRNAEGNPTWARIMFPDGAIAEVQLEDNGNITIREVV